MKERDKGQGSPEQNNPKHQRNKNPNELGKNSHDFPILKPEQPPQSAGNNKPEIHPPKEIPLAQELNLPGYEQRSDDLDPKVEEAIRRYGMTFEDHQERVFEEEKLRQSARKYREVRESLLGHNIVPLAYSVPDICRILKKQEKKD